MLVIQFNDMPVFWTGVKIAAMQSFLHAADLNPAFSIIGLHITEVFLTLVCYSFGCQLFAHTFTQTPHLKELFFFKYFCDLSLSPVCFLTLAGTLPDTAGSG